MTLRNPCVILNGLSLAVIRTALPVLRRPPYTLGGGRRLCRHKATARGGTARRSGIRVSSNQASGIRVSGNQASRNPGIPATGIARRARRPPRQQRARAAPPPQPGQPRGIQDSGPSGAAGLRGPDSGNGPPDQPSPPQRRGDNAGPREQRARVAPISPQPAERRLKEHELTSWQIHRDCPASGGGPFGRPARHGRLFRVRRGRPRR